MGSTKLIDLSGLKYGCLSVVNFSHKDKSRRYRWNCICDCKNKVTVTASFLKQIPKRCSQQCLKKLKYNIEFFTKPDDISMYWLGFLFADGFMYLTSGNTWELAVRLGIKDIEHLELYKQDCQAKNMIRMYPDQVELRLQYDGFTTILKQYGIVPRKTENWTTPIIENNIESFLVGWLDGDGCIYVSKQGWLRISVSFSCLESRAFYIEKLKELGYVNHIQIGYQNNCWSLTINGVENIKLLKKCLDINNQKRLLSRKWDKVSHIN